MTLRVAVAKLFLRAAIGLMRLVERAMFTESGKLEAADMRRGLSDMNARYFDRRRFGPPRARRAR